MPAETSAATQTAPSRVQAGDNGAGTATFYDPDSLAGNQDALPIATVGESAPSEPIIPEQRAVAISYAGQIVPVLPVPDGINTGPAMAQGNIFAINDTGQVAAVYPDGELYIGQTRVEVSPASRFGLDPNLSYGDLAWSPDGRYLALRVDAANPQHENSIDSGIWVYDPATNRSWQVFRNTYEGDVTQLHQQRRALNTTWAPNSAALAIAVETPVGPRTVFLPTTHAANDWVDSIPYADATWMPDSSGLVVSGSVDGEQSVVGHVALDADWSYTEFLNQNMAGLTMQAAIQLLDGRIAFFGGSGDNMFALYTIQPVNAAQPVRVSQGIQGQIIAVEWNAERNAALVTVETNGQRRLWIVRTDGAIREITPSEADTFSAAHWR